MQVLEIGRQPPVESLPQLGAGGGMAQLDAVGPGLGYAAFVAAVRKILVSALALIRCASASGAASGM